MELENTSFPKEEATDAESSPKHLETFSGETEA
jgi:hypothetical protein